MKRAFVLAGLALLASALVLSVCYLIFGWGLERSEQVASYRLVASWEGPSEWPFDQPYGIGVDLRNGNVLVTDAQNQRVVVFDPAGKFLREFGSKGKGTGQFALPAGVAVGADGSIYVADYMQDRVQKFSETGVFILQWGSTGSGNEQLRNPGGLAVDKHGNVYVADIFNHRISEFDAEGKSVRLIGQHGKWRLGDFDYPSDVDVAGDGRLLVADTYNHRVQLLDPRGKDEAAWGWYLFWLWPRTAADAHGFGEVASAAFGRANAFIHVADSKNRRLVMLDARGCFVTDWSVPGSAGKAQTPIQVAVSPDGHTVYATDIANNRVLVLAVDFNSNKTKEANK